MQERNGVQAKPNYGISDFNNRSEPISANQLIRDARRRRVGTGRHGLESLGAKEKMIWLAGS